MMISFLLYGIVLSLIIILIIIVKDELKILKILGMVGIALGINMLLIGYIIRLIIKQKINFINISKISDIITDKFLMFGLISITIGGLSLLLYRVIIIVYKNK